MWSFLFRLAAGTLIAVLLFDRLTRKYCNPYKLFLIFGKKGSGKSTYLTKLSVKYLKKGWNVYSNMPDLTVPGTRYINIDELGDFVPEANSLLLVDEVGMIWDNRNFKSFKPSVRDFFKLQRHYKVVVYLASQSFDVDKKIRDLTDGMYLQQNVARCWTVGRKIRRQVTLTEPVGDMESKIVESLKWCPFWDWTFTFIPHWAKMFDSRVIPEMPYLSYTEVSEPEMDELPDPDEVPAEPSKALDRLRRVFRRKE